jgi:hypothetical protein
MLRRRKEHVGCAEGEEQPEAALPPPPPAAPDIQADAEDNPMSGGDKEGPEVDDPDDKKEEPTGEAEQPADEEPMAED